MKNTILSITLFLFSTTLHAEIEKIAVMDVSCTSQFDDAIIIDVSSSPSGTSIWVNDKLVRDDKQPLIATQNERGKPHIKISEPKDGYGLALYGGDFSEAFEHDLVISNGKANSYTDQFDDSRTKSTVHKAHCQGSFAFYASSVSPGGM